MPKFTGVKRSLRWELVGYGYGVINDVPMPRVIYEVGKEVVNNLDQSIRDDAIQETTLLIIKEAKKNIKEGYPKSNTPPTGRLARTIRIEPYKLADTMTIAWGGPDVPYGAIHDRAGVTSIFARTKPFLVFPNRRRLLPSGKHPLVKVPMSRRPGTEFMSRAVSLGLARFPSILKRVISIYKGPEPNGFFKITSSGRRVYIGGSKSIAQYKREGLLPGQRL